jgi:hypothetical protein
MFRPSLSALRRAVAIVSFGVVAALPLLAPAQAHADWYHRDRVWHHDGWYHDGWQRGFFDHRVGWRFPARDWHGDRFRGHWR